MPISVFHLHLIDPGHLIFDWFFDGDDLAVRFVDVIEATVKRGRFSGAGRAGYKENSVRQSDQTFERFRAVRKKSEPPANQASSSTYRGSAKPCSHRDC